MLFITKGIEIDDQGAFKSLSQGQRKSVYLCYGSEKYLMNEFIRKCIDQLLEPEYVEFAVSKYDLNETNIADVIEDVETMPFMSSKKIVIAENAYFFTAVRESAKQAKIEHRIERLMEYMQSPVDYSVLILTVNEDKLDERKKLVKMARELAGVISCVPLAQHDLSAWVSDQVQRLNLKMDQRAMEQFLLYAGTDLNQLNSELQKLSLYAGENGLITAATIEQLVVQSVEHHVFQLVDEIVEMNAHKALAILSELLKNKEEPIKILMLIARQFRIILQAKESLQRGYPMQQIASRLKIPPFAVKKALQQGKAFKSHRLKEIMSELAQLDVQMKTGRVDKIMGLELFILRLAAKKSIERI